jgi:hypothetical protein
LRLPQPFFGPRGFGPFHFDRSGDLSVGVE